MKKVIILLCFSFIFTALLTAVPPFAVSTNVSGDDVVLTWSDSTNADIYYIYRSLQPDSNFTKIDSVADTTYTDVDAALESKYFYYVTAYTEDIFAWCDVLAGDYTFGEGDTIKNIPYDYQIMKYEVTNAQYRDYLQAAYEAGAITVTDYVGAIGYYPGDENWMPNDYVFYNLGTYIYSAYDYARISFEDSIFVINVPSGYDPGDFDDHPAVFVTWFGAWAFAQYHGLDLPTEEEWEKAARGNTGYDYPWGDSIDDSRANYWYSDDPWDNRTTPVGMYNGQNIMGFATTDSPSPYGAYDMAGNIVEWTDSWWSDTSDFRVLRGGSWNVTADEVKSWYRFNAGPPSASENQGFRCIR